MKRFLISLGLALLLAAALSLGFSASAEVYSGDCGADGDNVTWELDTDTGVLTISGEGVIISDLKKGDPIPQDSYRFIIEKVVIKNGITGIGDYAFEYCSSLTEVTIGNSVTSIGDYAFGSCSSLTSISIPGSVTSIGDLAFRSCSSLTSIIVAEDNNNYSSDERGVLFNKDKTKLIRYPAANTATEYEIPDSVTSISIYAFDSCAGITSIEIPNSVTTIDEGTFQGCESLTSITIPGSVTSIGDYAFAWCESLASVIIPESVTSIGNKTFRKCTNLTGITIPESVTSIDRYAFYYCKNLTIYGYANSYAQTYATDNNIPFVVIGDADNNGTMTHTDATTIAQFLSQSNAAYSPSADINLDGKITLTDLRELIHQLIKNK